jgi:hypothetical protein
MALSEAIIDFEPAIQARLIQAPKAPIAPEAAHYLLSIDFTEADHARMRELMEKSGDGVLIAEEKAELDGYVKIANVLSVMHSQARVVLRNSGVEPLRDLRHS